METNSVKILIVEDDLNLAALLRCKLQQEAYTVESVETGTKAFSFLCANPADLMILDLNLPDIDGY